MPLAATCLFLATVPQLRVEPVPGVVGEPMHVSLRREGAPSSGVAIDVELPDGTSRPCGVTTMEGRVAFVPERAGRHVFRAVIDGVTTLAPAAVTEARERWPLALGAVPLGLALLYVNLRRAGARRAGA